MSRWSWALLVLTLALLGGVYGYVLTHGGTLRQELAFAWASPFGPILAAFAVVFLVGALRWGWRLWRGQ